MYITFEIIKGPVSWEDFESAVIGRCFTFIRQNLGICCRMYHFQYHVSR